MRIIISRTDSIGDVVLTLPMAGALKQATPGCTIIFLGKEYTRAVVERCCHIDEFVVWEPPPRPSPKKGREDEGTNLLRGLKADVIIHVFPVKEICVAARRAGIPVRIATGRRWFTWFTCNRLLHIPRKNSDLHEAQLNLKMLRPLGIDRGFGLEEIGGLYGLTGGQADGRTGGQADGRTGGHADGRTGGHADGWTGGRFRLILHPKSKGSAREWGLENYSKLIELLPAEDFEIIITGTKEEGALMAGFLEHHRNRVQDMTGKLTLPELITLIGSSDGLVAASTGPLHIAAALGIRAVGLYAPMRPIFPQRWAPVGKNATYLVLEKNCHDCRKTMDCACIRSITPEEVVACVKRDT
jgi:ADP-heptose:LPS heptosyltransferase